MNVEYWLERYSARIGTLTFRSYDITIHVYLSQYAGFVISSFI